MSNNFVADVRLEETNEVRASSIPAKPMQDLCSNQPQASRTPLFHAANRYCKYQYWDPGM